MPCRSFFFSRLISFFFFFILFLYRITHHNLNGNAKEISQSILIYIVSTYINKSGQTCKQYSKRATCCLVYDECNWIIGPLIELNWIRAKRLMYVDDAFLSTPFAYTTVTTHTVSFYSHLLRKNMLYHFFGGLLLTIHEEFVVASSSFFSLIKSNNFFSGPLRIPQYCWI